MPKSWLILESDFGHHVTIASPFARLGPDDASDSELQAAL
jgi:hypothetical protein